MNLFNFEEYSEVLKSQLKQETTHLSQPFGQEATEPSQNEEMLDCEERPRLISELDWDPAKSSLPSVRPILEFLKCSICQDTAVEPRVIKHCLHFFCKECIERYVLRQ